MGTQGTEIGQWFTKRPVLETGTFAGNLSLYVAKLRLPRAVMGLTRLPVVGAKVAFFRGYTVKSDRNRHENDAYCCRSLCFVSHVTREPPELGLGLASKVTRSV